MLTYLFILYALLIVGHVCCMKNKMVGVFTSQKAVMLQKAVTVTKGCNVAKGCNITKGCNVTCLRDFM